MSTVSYIHGPLNVWRCICARGCGKIRTDHWATGARHGATFATTPCDRDAGLTATFGG
jgi:hypothetical protein